jgi:hypothetical protein
MEKKKKITYVTSDEWEGIYVDGKLVCENHSLSIREFLEYTGVECDRMDCDEDWMADHGHLPEDLAEVKKSKEDE